MMMIPLSTKFDKISDLWQKLELASEIESDLQSSAMVDRVEKPPG